MSTRHICTFEISDIANLTSAIQHAVWKLNCLDIPDNEIKILLPRYTRPLFERDWMTKYGILISQPINKYMGVTLDYSSPTNDIYVYYIDHMVSTVEGACIKIPIAL